MGSKVKTSEFDMLAVLADEAGIFTWDVVTDRLCGDAFLAKFFGLQESELENGLPIEVFLNRMHANDRERVARAIHTAIVTGQLFNETYRIVRPDMSCITVVVMGRCFHYNGDVPASCAGIALEVVREEKATYSDTAFSSNIVPLKGLFLE